MEDPKENTLELWEQFNSPPSWALKTIKGGRLKGMTDINPQWRYQAITKVLGPCGVGWKFGIIKQWMEIGANSEVVAFVTVHLFIRCWGTDGSSPSWSDPIPGTGGSKFVAKESSGLHTNDECYKMATTDALTTAMKMIGVGADVYQGRWDGSKYLETVDTTAPPKIISPIQFDILAKIIDTKKVNEKKFLEYMGIKDLAELQESQFSKAKDVLDRAKGETEGEPPQNDPPQGLPEVDGEPRP